MKLLVRTASIVTAAMLLAHCSPPSEPALEAAMPTATPVADTLAEGPARERVEALCTSCHNANMILNSNGRTRDQWDTVVSAMLALNAEDEAAVLDYLAEHYPPSYTPRPARLVAGALQVSFREWRTERLGQRPRDPVQAPDGMIWYVGQQGNTIGRIDPNTNQVREWPLPEGALPHSVNVDAQGGVWYMGNGNGTIGKFDPATGQVRAYRMPDPNARDPHTAEFDRNGIMWFTLQQSNMIGRFDPRSGDIRLATVERAGARPYGLKLDASGTPWVACNGSNCIIRVDPNTMALTEIDIPGEGTTIRRLDIADDGMIWYVNSGRGKLGRYNPQSGEIREWDSPSGADSHPYAIAVIDGIVWYNESGVRPEPLVRFDPRTETFQSWAIPPGGGIARHIRATRDGNLLLHQGSSNSILLATLPRAR